MSYREHPGLYEQPPAPPELNPRGSWETGWGAEIAWLAERAAYNERHAPELERQAYECSKPVKVPPIGSGKAILR